jgi:hypothetical protein
MKLTATPLNRRQRLVLEQIRFSIDFNPQVGGQVLDLLGEGTDAGKLTRGWRVGIFLRRHGVGSGNHPIFGVGDPEVERLSLSSCSARNAGGRTDN